MTIGFIGCGNMGAAIIKGITKARFSPLIHMNQALTGLLKITELQNAAMQKKLL